MGFYYVTRPSGGILAEVLRQDLDNWIEKLLQHWLVELSDG